MKPTFSGSVKTLMSGTIGAQVIGLALLPLLTRLYSPADFELLAIFVGIVGILSVAACLRFEIAIPLPKSRSEAFALLALCLISAFIISLLTLVISLLFSFQFSLLLNKPQFEHYFYIVPFGVFFVGVYNAFQYWATRNRNFGLISKTKLLQAMGGGLVQCLIGFIHPVPIGLIFGHIVTSGVGTTSLSKDLRRTRASFKKITFIRLKAVFRKYDRFPRYSVAEALGNSAAIQLPVLIIASLGIGPEAGFFFLAMRVCLAPMVVIGSSISQVFLAGAADQFREDTLGIFTGKIVTNLLLFGAPALIFLGSVSPKVFPFIFGEEWVRTGELITWMVPWFIFQFVVSPVSIGLHVVGCQRTALLLQLFGLIFRLGVLALAAIYFRDYIVEIFSLSGFLFYILYLLIVCRKLKVSFRGLERRLFVALFLSVTSFYMGKIILFFSF